MSDLSLMKILWGVATVTSTVGVLGMLSLYKELSIQMSIIATSLLHVIRTERVIKYGTGIQRMAEDTEVGK